MTTTPMVRGYMVLSALDYIDNNYDAPTRERIHGALSPDVRNAVMAIDKVQWYPRRYCEQLLAQIALLHSPDDDASYAALVGVGRQMAKNATNSFLRLFMKIMTPSLFARKANDLWTRDHREGTMSVDTEAIDRGAMTVHLRGIEGYEYFGPVAVGFLAFALETMGKRNVEVTLAGWSMQNPTPPETAYHVKWK